jgi:hypothetical protein
MGVTVSLIEIKADLTRTANALEKIAEILERAFPVVPPGEELKPFTKEHYSQANEDQLLEAELRELLRQRNPELEEES